jgi:PAS domain S-box-containing protein
MWSQFRHFISPNTNDPDEIRRSRLLKILSLGILACAALGSLATIGYMLLIPAARKQDDVWLMLVSALAFLLGSVVIFYINKRSSRLAALLFLTLLTIVFSFSDTPLELSGGRSSFVFVIPIAVASLILSPASSFLFAGIDSIIIAWLASRAQIFINFPAIVGFFMLALISWLSSRSLENAIKEVRTINAELDQRVAERTLELSEALSREQAEASRRQAILQSIADGVIVFNVNGEAMLANPAISHMLEIPFDGILGYTFYDIFQTPQISDDDRHLLARTMRDLDSTLVPIRIQWGKKTLSVNAAPVRNAKGQPMGKVAVLRDFTREAEVEQMKNRFVAMVSHELRTPLNAILGFSEMLREAFYGPMNEKQTNAADRILKNSRRLLEIVSDLLDQAQIEAGHLAFNLLEFNTNDLTENLHSVVDQIAQAKGLALKSEIVPDMPATLKGDPQRLQQVLVNLVNNAIKFTEKGSISVRIYRVSDQNWGFDVTDTGPGIAAENQKNIFDPFRQVDGTATRAHGGIGLGLSIVQKLVDLMSGRIFVKSIMGQGSTFTVILPFEPPHGEENHEPK